MPAEQRFWTRRAAALAGLVVVALGTPACNDPPANEPIVTGASEPGFAEQAAAVRQGRSEQIRLDHTSVRDEQLDDLDGLEDKLRRINLSHSDITDAGLERIARMRKLIQLRLASDRVTDAGLACLEELKELRHLHLIDAPITDAGLEHLHALEGLESLYLDGIRATDEGISRLVEALPGVHLHIDGGHHRVDPHANDHEH